MPYELSINLNYANIGLGLRRVGITLENPYSLQSEEKLHPI